MVRECWCDPSVTGLPGKRQQQHNADAARSLHVRDLVEKEADANTDLFTRFLAERGRLGNDDGDSSRGVRGRWPTSDSGNADTGWGITGSELSDHASTEL